MCLRNYNCIIGSIVNTFKYYMFRPTFYSQCRKNCYRQHQRECHNWNRKCGNEFGCFNMQTNREHSCHSTTIPKLIRVVETKKKDLQLNKTTAKFRKSDDVVASFMWCNLGIGVTVSLVFDYILRSFNTELAFKHRFASYLLAFNRNFAHVCVLNMYVISLLLTLCII